MVNPRYITEPHDCEFHGRYSHSWQITDKEKNELIKCRVWECSQCGNQWVTIAEITDLVSDDNWLDDRFLNSP